MLEGGDEDERSDEIQDGGEIEKEEGQEQGEYRNEDKPSVSPCLRVFVFPPRGGSAILSTGSPNFKLPKP